MLLWAILTVIAVAVAVACTVPLVRRYEERPSARAAALTILGEQLADIDNQVAGGAIDPAQADALRTEVKRRMLTSPTTEAPPRPLGPATLGRLAIGLAVVVAVAGTYLYTSLGRPDLAVDPALTTAGNTAVAPDAASTAAANADVASMVTQLETRMQDNPNDAEGWRMLGWSYFQTSRFKESADAYGKAVALTPAAPGFASAYGEALVQAAGGRMTKEALAQFRAANLLDRQDARARYFLGVAKAESGDRRGAVDDWLALLSESPADAPWGPELRRVILETAKADGRDVSAQIGSAPAAGGPAAAPAAGGPAAGGPVTSAPNPTAEQVQAVQALPQQDQQAMIRGMVDSLAAKLKANPKDPEGWVRLMRARLVLGDRAAAAAAKRDAQAALAGDAAGTATVTQGAAALGL